jgi:pyruvate carboxylase subunit B
MEGKKVGITETVLRDAHQSLLATRMRTEDMLPIAEDLDKIGFWSVEMWGGATFDACLRYLNEDPWERLRLIR